MKEKITELKNRILSDPLSKGIVIIASGSIIAQLIGIITTLIITRLYSPSDFGVLGLFTATLSILAIAGGLRYDLALPLPTDDKDAANLFTFFLILLLITSVFLSIVIFLFGDLLLSFFQVASLKSFLILLIIGFFGTSLYGVFSLWVTRRKDYTRITYSKIYQSIGGSITKILFGIVSAGPQGLLIGQIVSQVMGIGTLFRYMWENDRASFHNVSFFRMVENAKKYIRFPLFSFPSGIINVLAFQLPIFMLSAIYGLSVVGMYSLASSLLLVTSSLISTSMNQVYYAEISDMIRDNSQEIKNLYISTTRKLLIVGIPLIMIPCLLAPFLFPIIFGDIWKDAGFYCLPLSMVAIANFVISPTSNLSAYGFNHWALMWDISRTILLFMSFWIIQLLSLQILIALFIYSSVMALMYGVNYLLNIRAIDLWLQKDTNFKKLP
jgi:O-antigen/teichoic acid export membrane protein